MTSNAPNFSEPPAAEDDFVISSLRGGQRFRPGAGPADIGRDANAVLESRAHAALGQSVQRLLSLQAPEGWWKGELETNVSIDAEDILLREFLGIREEERSDRSAAWIRSRQREDGTWASFFGGPGELSITTEAYVALRVVGDSPDQQHMAAAAAFIRQHGGTSQTRVFTKIWLALFGLWSWDQVPSIPPELILLPPWSPYSIYNFSCWARQTVVPLSIVTALRPARPLQFDLSELAPETCPEESSAKPRASIWSMGSAQRLISELPERLASLYGKAPLKPLRKRALGVAERWILQRQEADGGWGGIQPPWVYSIIALHLLGYSTEHPVLAAGMGGLEKMTITDDRGTRVEACQSPVWDTALALQALLDAGVPPNDPALQAAARWLIAEQVNTPGDWTVRRPELEPGGWSFEFQNDNYPDVDDTAVVLAALGGMGSHAPEGTEGALRRGLAWALGMQCSNGGWAAFDVENDSSLLPQLPFCDFGEVTDPPSADVTGHMVELAGIAGFRHAPGMKEAAEKAVEWLLQCQEPDGAWFGRWGANYLYGTAAVVAGLVSFGMEEHHPALARAKAWVIGHQNPDGGWGEDLRGYTEADWRGRGTSTPSQTAWAILSLVALGEDRSEASKAGIAWLLERQNGDGGWDEEHYSGVGFPGDFYINYHLYRDVYPTMALARWLQATRPK